MFTRKALIKHIESFLVELIAAGYDPTKVILFGSYANGSPTEMSDIDLAVWDARFTGSGTVDVTPIASIISKHQRIELHPFAEGETEEINPFISEIVKKGIRLQIPSLIINLS